MLEIMNCIYGTLKPITEVDDEVFASKMMGEGIAIIPKDNIVYAPIAGVVTMLFPTKHAVGLQSSDGIELLIHIGIDTVELDGQGFTAFISQGEHVQLGQQLISFDRNLIDESGYSSDTMMIITEAKGRSIQWLAMDNDYNQGECVIQLE